MKMKYWLPSMLVAALFAGGCADKAHDGEKLVILDRKSTRLNSSHPK